MRPAWVTALRVARRRVAVWCCAPAAVSAVVAAAAREWTVVLAVTMIGSLVGVALAAAGWSEGGGRGEWLTTAAAGLVGSWSAFSLVLLPTVWPWGVPALLALGLLLGLVSLRRVVRRMRRDLERSLDVIELAYCPPQRQHTVITNAPTSDLVGIWQKTGTELGGRSGALLTTRLCYVELRCSILDELESRDPGAFERWLGAPDAADIRKYLAG